MRTPHKIGRPRQTRRGSFLSFAAILLVGPVFWCTAVCSAAERPNVLLIISDDLTTSLGCYGNSVVQTPHLDRLAGEGVRFDRAYCQYPVCGPSRASLMSGLYPNRTRMLGNTKVVGSYRVTNPELDEHPSIGRFFRQHGYYSARVSKIYHMGIPGGIEVGEPGGDEPESWDRAFDIMAPETFSPGKLELLSPIRKHFGSNFARVIVPNEHEATQTDHMSATQAIAILENRSKSAPEQPFFLAVGFVRPHVPLVAPERLFQTYPAEQMTLPENPANDLADVPEPARGMENMGRYGMNELQQKQSISGYYASVSFMDEQVGRLLQALDRLNLRDETIVVFISDHGYNLGEHFCWQKLSLFEDATRVPLIISAPGFEPSAGQATDGIVELIDLYPTLADLTGLAADQPEILQGTSLRPLLENPRRRDWSKPHAYTVTYRDGESLRTPRWRYNRWGEVGEELYDHDADPREFHNLADDTQHQATLTEFRARLQQVRDASR